MLRIAILTLLAGGIAVPSMAAGTLDEAGGGERKFGVFAGATVRLPMGGRAAARPQATLQLTSVQAYQRAHAPLLVSAHRPRGLELSFNPKNGPDLNFNGVKASSAGRRAGLDGDSTPLWIVGGVVAAGALLFVAAEIFDNKAEAEPFP